MHMTAGSPSVHTGITSASSTREPGALKDLLAAMAITLVALLVRVLLVVVEAGCIWFAVTATHLDRRFGVPALTPLQWLGVGAVISFLGEMITDRTTVIVKQVMRLLALHLLGLDLEEASDERRERQGKRASRRIRRKAVV
jgi:hypothetical protein